MQAQRDGPDESLAPQWELTPYLGVAVDSPGGPWGITPDRNHLFAGIHATMDLVRTPRWTFAYAPELVPLLIVTGNPRVVEETLPEPRLGNPGPVAGVGVSPFGLETQLHVRRRWRLFAAAAAGAVWFTRDVPVPFSRSFNYTLEYGAGVVWRRSQRTSWRFGYKYHHLSNAYSGLENPGLDGHVFLLGVSFKPSPAQEYGR